MRRMWKQTSPSQPSLSSLRQRLKQPGTWLLIFGAIAALAVLDSLRCPEFQVTGRCYVGAVRIYQLVGRPLLAGQVQCRYCPSCSDYSVEAVELHGIRSGLVLTFRRLSSCQTTVPPNTLDPVPPR